MEIGSEFSENSISFGENKYFSIVDYPKRYVLSGRTGLHLIAKELKASVENISLPNYSCNSMILPFYTEKFNISFYDSINLDNVVLNRSIQAILIMDYFGFLSMKTFNFVVKCKNAGVIVIVDATQTAFSHAETYRLADYIVISYRKWFDSLCAVVYSKNGFKLPKIDSENHFYDETWRKAARIKASYLNSLTSDKSKYLKLYAEANQNLSHDYIGYTANKEEIEIVSKADSSTIRKLRRENAGYLIHEIKKIQNKFGVQLIFDNMKEEDCPLFVPLLLDEKNRFAIRDVLIKNDIYCPIHWPIDGRYPYENTSYHRRELSLICDQRYGIREMGRQISVLTQALQSNC